MTHEVVATSNPPHEQASDKLQINLAENSLFAENLHSGLCRWYQSRQTGYNEGFTMQNKEHTGQ